MEFSVLTDSPRTSTKKSKARFHEERLEDDEEEFCNTRKNKNNGISNNTYMISTPPTTPHRQRYYKASPSRLQSLRDELFNESSSSSSCNSTKSNTTSSPGLVRQRTMPILESPQISPDIGTLRRVQSATEGATSISEATVEKIERQQEYEKLQQQQQRKKKLNQDDALQKYPWNHDTWLNLSRYYEAVGRNVDRTVNVFYRHESIEVIKDSKGGRHDIMERWSQDTIRWKVLCLVYATIKHGGIALFQRVQAYNEKKRRRRYNDEQKQHRQQLKKQVNDDDDHEELDEVEQRRISKKRCRR
ncbi:hypothetical protein INT45_002521 [Circinella minor]|uniref:Uncharacterized protein n=1 Tax=Circinella minor TaxID=1195481 RepID=A0A8H7VMG8_9FUNG|nr:hypothetical protein INT45_002521 [Circinella minor]